MAGKTVFRLVQMSVMLAVLLVLSTCGGKSKGNTPSVPGIDAAQTDAQTPIEIPRDETLAELERMECPEGVEEALFDELKDALVEALKNSCRAAIYGRRDSSRKDDGGDESPPYSDSSVDGDGHSMLCPYKSVATPPTGEANRVNDLTITDNGDGTFTLSWHYKNLGDYDQNGTVGISDITPLAIHYGEEVAEGDTERNSIQAVVDGSRNDIVDIADITPVAMNYGIECVTYSIRSALSYPEDIEETSEINTAPVALAEGDDRKIFSVELTLSPLTYVAVAPVDAEGEFGELSNAVELPPEPYDTFSFAIVADPHIDGNVDHETALRIAVQWIIDNKESRDIELVFIVGDIAWGAAGELRNLQIAKEILDALTDAGVLYVPVMGDNEVAAGSELEFNDVFGVQYQYLSGVLENWQKADVPVSGMYLQNFSFDRKLVHFVGADFVSRETGDEGGELHDFPGGSWQWFKNDITNSPKLREENTIVLTHIGMFCTGIPAVDEFLFTEDEMAKVIGFLDAYGEYVDSNYSGHIHQNLYTVVLSESGTHLYDVWVTDETWYDTVWPEIDDHETTVRVVSVDSTATSFSYTQDVVDAGLQD